MITYLLALPVVLALLLATTNAYAMQLSFDPSTGQSFLPANFGLPAAFIVAASLGALLIINERRKARGIWFSNSERLK